jgi:ADP-ribosylglycohydrolase/protein-tyrosine phosphatase
MVRTSQTDPIQVAEVMCGRGVIGVTFCPGKSGTSVFGAPWARDLDVDIAAIRAWGASLVLTLIEDHEFELLQVQGLGEAVRAAGMTWIHAPIRDVDVPGEDFERRWAVVGHKVRAELRRANRVLIHCRGGRGRAGMIAARLMVELGESPAEAIRRMRDARPGTIETSAQEAHVRSARARPEHEQDDRVLGCLLGGSVGDAFGYAVEFDRLVEIRRRHGAEGLTQPQLQAGKFIVSDDTQMTLFTAEALNRSGASDGFIDECRAAYLRWYETQTRHTGEDEKGLLAHAPLWERRAPGNTCMSALAQGGKGTTEHRINDSKGCGGVMRTAPIGLVRHWDERAAFQLGVAAAALTHGHPSGFFSAAAMAAIVRNLLDGADLTAAIERASHLLSEHVEAKDTRDAMERAVALARQSQDGQDVARGALGQGWVGEEALAIAVYSCLVGSDFEETMRIAANHDGDSDSTASIAGQLFGARWGLALIPWRWIEPLDVFDAACEVLAPFVCNGRGSVSAIALSVA